MRPSLLLLALLSALGLAACVEEGTYPISGEECAPDDPVHDFGATDCAPVTGPGVGGL
ncbi:MAG: hypothetical protein HKN18_01460 [Silicimonas sp.]|nr:hypothetical protein [Silicimonas sp.]